MCLCIARSDRSIGAPPLQAKVIRPVWQQQGEAGMSPSRPGVLLLEFAPAAHAAPSGSGSMARAYQWDAKQVQSRVWQIGSKHPIVHVN
jgi:Whirly transcription factor